MKPIYLAFLFLFLLFSLSFSLDIMSVKQKAYDMQLLKTASFDGVDEEISLSENSMVNLSGSDFWIISVSSPNNVDYYNYLVISDKKPTELVSESQYEQIIKSKVFVDYLAGKELYYSSTLTNYFLNLSTELDTMNYNIDLFENSLKDEALDMTDISNKVSGIKQEISALESTVSKAEQESNDLDSMLIALKKEIAGNINEDLFNSANSLSEDSKDILSGYNGLDAKLQILKSITADLNIDVQKKSIIFNFFKMSPLLQSFGSNKEVIDSSFSNVQKAYNQSANNSFIKKLSYDWAQRKYRGELFRTLFSEDKEIKSKTKKSTLDLAITEIISNTSVWKTPDAKKIESEREELYAIVKKGTYKAGLENLDDLRSSVLSIYLAGKQEITVDDSASASQDKSKQYLYYVLYALIGLFIIFTGYKLYRKYATKANSDENDTGADEGDDNTNYEI